MSTTRIHQALFMMAEQGQRRARQQIGEEERAIIRNGYRLHRNNFVRLLAYVKNNFPEHLPPICDGRTDVAGRRRIRDFVIRDVQK